jgi:hypothetical protein
MDKKPNNLFDEMLRDDSYRKLLDNVPEDIRPILVENLRKLVTDFDEKLLSVLRDDKGDKTP